MNKPAKIVSACAACGIAVALGAYVYKLNSGENDVPTFSSVVESTVPPAATEEPVTEPEPELPANWAEGMKYVPSNTGMTDRAKQLLKLNPDIIGWIKIDNTICDYPVVIDPGEVEEGSPFYGPEAYIPDSYYLDHDLDRSYKRSGTLFLDYRDVFGSNEEEQSENLVIYGHNMADNTMFGSIRRYRQDYDFYDVSPFIELSSNYRDYEYVIFAFLITSGSYDATDFHYWNMEELDTKEDFDFFVDRCKSWAMLDTGVDVQYGDKLLTLSTCYADEDNSRFLVVARRLRDGEVPGDMSTIVHTEEWIKAHTPEEPSEETSEEAQE